MKLNKLLVLCSTLACGLTLAACGGEKNSEPAKSEEPTVSEQGNDKVSAYVGMGYDASYSDGQCNVTAAMVAFDANGKVVGTRIDVVQCKVKVGADGGLVLNYADGDTTHVIDGRVATKCELGTNYNMVTYGEAIAEVDNQIESYAAWTVGKTVSEINAAQAFETIDDGHKEDGYFTTDEDLFAECTITVDSFARAVSKAYENKSASAYELTNGFKVGVAINAKPADNHGNPSTEVSVDLGGVVVNNGKVEAAAIDACVFSFSFATEGEGEGAVTTFAINKDAKYHEGSTDDTLVVLSKKDLGEKYAMKPPSALEWYEHAALIEDGVVGMDVANVAGIAEGDIEGATITISSYVSALARAAQYATVEHIGPQAE